MRSSSPSGPARRRLNALSGIGGVQTCRPGNTADPVLRVLMPCRALEAFRRGGDQDSRGLLPVNVLMPCRALEAFRPDQPMGVRALDAAQS